MLLYYLFRNKNITPGDFYQMLPGERLLVTAFCQREAEERREMQNARHRG